MNGGIGSSGRDGSRSTCVGRGMASPKCLFLIVCLLGLNIEPSWSSCSYPAPIANATIQLLTPHLHPKDGKYPEGAEAQITCLPGYHFAYAELKYQTCGTYGEWSHSVNPDGPTCVPNRCLRPPPIHNGHYTSENSRHRVGRRSDESYPVGTVLEPACDASFSLNCSGQCGRITCVIEGTWGLMDGRLISQCVDEPLRVRSNLSHPEHGEDKHSDSSFKGYMVLIVAAICIAGVFILTIVFVRRPNFCKKHNQGPRGYEETPAIITSSSPVPYMDSLPVSMNTGIFMPGASYDLQDCHFQDSPLVGTTVFK